MILIGTEHGIYRWFEGCNWPIFHSLQDRSVVALTSPGAGVLVGLDKAGDVLESTNNGLDWRVLRRPEGSARSTAVAVFGTPPSILLAVKPIGALTRAVGAALPSEEGGSSTSTRFLRRARGLAEGATALLAPRQTRAKPVDGSVWIKLTAPPVPRTTIAPVTRSLAVAAGGPGVWFAAVSGAGVWKSADLGRSWSQCPGLPAEVHAVRAVADRPGDLWAASHDGCWFSADLGASWEDRSAGLEKARHVRAIEVKPGAPDTLLAGCAPPAPFETVAPRQGLNFALYESTNGGQSWAQVKRNFPDVLENDTIADIRHDPAAPDNVIVALGSGELWYSQNAGAYWGPLARQIHSAWVLCGVREQCLNVRAMTMGDARQVQSVFRNPAIGWRCLRGKGVVNIEPAIRRNAARVPK